MPQEALLDVTLISDFVSTRFTVLSSGQTALIYTINGTTVPREDFTTVMGMHALIGQRTERLNLAALDPLEDE